MFLANNSDGLSDPPLPVMLDHFQRHDAVASFVGVVPPANTFHLVSVQDGGKVTSIRHVREVGMRINADTSLREDWPCKYCGLEPLDKRRRDWPIRYASFQLD